MRDKFRFLVGRGLEIRNIIFNAIDSVLIPSIDPGNCLTQIQNCCSITDNNLIGCDYAKKPYYFHYNEFRTVECVMTAGTSFIEFDIGPRNVLISPPTLTIYVILHKFIE